MKSLPSIERPDLSRTAVTAGIAALLLLVAVVYARTAWYPLLEGDDAVMVAQHPVVSHGLTGQGLAWSLTHGLYGIWMPLTALTHMADVSLFGPWAGGHHLMSVLWHALAVLAFYAALRVLTGARGASLMAAALLAVHPLGVEDVAWISSRKDLVCGVFFALALLVHARHARRPGPARYAVLFAAVLLALAGKTSAAPIPAVLLLLDAWPLGRFRDADGAALSPRRVVWLMVEKLPLALLAIAVMVVTWRAQHEVGAVIETGAPPPLLRVAAAGGYYVHYLAAYFWPFGLSPSYPYPPLVLWKAAAAWALVVALSLGALAVRRERPWLAVGWFWFLAALVPVIGLMPYGVSPFADRYMYLPGMGLSLAVAWTLASLPVGRVLRASLCVALVLVLAGISWGQVRVWRDTWSLLERKMRVYPNDAPNFAKAGEWLLGKGDVDRAIACYREALRIAPDAVNYYNLGSALLDRNPAEAVQCLEKATQLNPADGLAWTNLGCALMDLNRSQDALAPLKEGVRLRPNDANALVNLGAACMNAGSKDEARAAFQRALTIDPANAAAQANLKLIAP